MRFISSSVFWTALGAIGVLITAFIYWRIYRTSRADYRINLTKAEPKVFPAARIERKQIRDFVIKPFVIVEIKNDGELPANDVRGHWNLASPTSNQNLRFPISIPQLGNSPEIYSQELIGSQILNAINSGEDIRIDVDIELEFLGLENEEKSCSAKYRYKKEIKNFTRIFEQSS